MTNGKVSVERMVYYESVPNDTPDHLGGIGGWFDEGMRWSDYLREIAPEAIPYAEAFREYVVKKNIRHGGYWHQNADDGCPIFSDGSTAQFSFRAWGDIMAAIWSEADQRDYWYMDFYSENYNSVPGEETNG